MSGNDNADVRDFPDAERVVQAVLKGANVPRVGNRVYVGQEHEQSKAVYPFVRVTRIGGLPVRRRFVDRAYIQVDVFDQDVNTARSRAAAAACRTALLQAENTVDETNGAVVVYAQDTLGLSNQPEPGTNRAHYVFGVMLTLHALARA